MKRRSLKDKPLISVVMSVYNCESYVESAIDSILNQTFVNFEFIIINDGSTDGTLSIIEKYKDPRIILISRENRGLVKSLNEGILIARGKYIARQDGDDISLPNKLQRQLELIESDKLILVSTSFSAFTTDPLKPIAHHALVNDDLILKRELFVQNPFGHGAIMFSRAAAIRVGLYEDVGPAEDYDLWARLMGTGSFGFVEEECYMWRINMEGVSQTQASRQQAAVREIKLNRLKGRPPALTLVDINSVLHKINSLNPEPRSYCIDRIIFDQKALIKKGLKRFRVKTLILDLVFLCRLLIKKISL